MEWIVLPCCTKEVGNNSRKQGSLKYFGICEKTDNNLDFLESIQKNKLFIIGGIGFVLFIFIIIPILAFFVKEIERKEGWEKETVTNNPLYGLDLDYDDYYAETRIEETNPHYDTYYNDDNTTNLTDYNEVEYGQEEKGQSQYYV